MQKETMTSRNDTTSWNERADRFCEAWSSEVGRPDFDALSKIYAADADVVIYDTLPPIEGFHGFEQMRRSIYPELTYIHVHRTGSIAVKHLAGGAIVVTSYPFHLSYGFSNGTGHEIDARISEVWEKRAGEYVIVHEHPSTIYASAPASKAAESGSAASLRSSGPHISGGPVFDHVVFGVSDYAASKSFFVKALEPLGVAVISEGPLGIELCRPNSQSSLCIRQEPDEKPAHLHLAFTAANRQQVEAFYRAALKAGAQDNGAPGLRPNYHANYYAAFVIGPDGHNIEAVCHEPEA